MATEVAILPLRKGINLDDSDSEAAQIWQVILKTLTRQQGFQRAYWGVEQENSRMLRFFVDWEFLEDHMAFRKKGHYQAFLDLFNKIIHNDQAQMFHAYLEPYPPSDVLNGNISPTTAVLAMHFPADYSVTDQRKFEETWNHLIATVKRDSRNVTGYAGGWVIEQLSIPETAEDAKVYAAYVGLQCADARLSYRQIQDLQDVKQFKCLQLCHSSLVMFESGDACPLLDDSL